MCLATWPGEGELWVAWLPLALLSMASFGIAGLLGLSLRSRSCLAWLAPLFIMLWPVTSAMQDFCWCFESGHAP